jgi:hypothetical protein
MENKYIYGSYIRPDFTGVHAGTGGAGGVGGTSRSYREEEKVKVVEEWVRTAMIAGHTADDYTSSTLHPKS